MAITVRAMTDSDLPAVLEIQHTTTLPQWPIESWNFELHEKFGARFLVAELAGGLIGYIGIWMLAEDAEIAVVATLESHRRQGVAGMLMGRILAEAQAAGVRNVFLEVRVSNTAAQTLYRQLGFERSHIRPDYYYDGEDAIVMQLTLPATGPSGVVMG